jgi:hypothetical protein
MSDAFFPNYSTAKQKKLSPSEEKENEFLGVSNVPLAVHKNLLIMKNNHAPHKKSSSSPFLSVEGPWNSRDIKK